MPYTQKWGVSRNAFQSPLNNNEVDTDPNSDEDIIAQNNKKAELEKSKNILDAFIKKNTGDKPVVSKKPTTIGGSEWEAKQKEIYETDSAWEQAGTLFKNPFQGFNALMQQGRASAQNLIGNETASTGPTSSLTNLRRAKEAKAAGADVYIPGEEMNMASQWIGPAVVASSAHQAATGAGQIATGNVAKGAGNIAGGLYSYIPGLGKIKGGKNWFSGSSFQKPFQKFWNLLDKGGTATYKTLKAAEQATELAP